MGLDVDLQARLDRALAAWNAGVAARGVCVGRRAPTLLPARTSLGVTPERAGEVAARRNSTIGRAA